MSMAEAQGCFITHYPSKKFPQSIKLKAIQIRKQNSTKSELEFKQTNEIEASFLSQQNFQFLTCKNIFHLKDLNCMFPP